MQEPHKTRIERGAQAISRPDFYASIGMDPEKLIIEGIASAKEMLKTNGEKR
jgi:hypothetical protein